MPGASARATPRNMRQPCSGKTIAKLEAKSKTATGKAKTDLDASLPAIRTHRTAFTTEMTGMESATATQWDAKKTALDKSWTDLKSLVDKAA